MATRSMTAITSGKENGTSQSVKSEEMCCNLSCLERPHFFCGQLLTDQDLMTLLGWALDKHRLNRFRQGWGVVCGLEVRCDPRNAGKVIVAPGYAMSCCGDDIIVCEDAAFDLGPACRKEISPCADPWELAASDVGSPPSETHLVDLYIQYAEQQADPQTALGKSACTQAADCEYARTRETFELHWLPAVAGSDPTSVEAQRWQNAYEKCWEVVTRFVDEFGLLYSSHNVQGSEVRNWLVRWIKENPLRQLGFVRDCLCTMNPNKLNDEALAAEILFWIVQDCRNAFLSHRCYECSDSMGVPLARVWLEPVESNGLRSCRVRHIDAYPPYRRLLQSEGWPAPLGSANLGRVIWHRPEDARALLAGAGVRAVNEETIPLPTTLAVLQDFLKNSLFVACGAEVILQTIEASSASWLVSDCMVPGIDFNRRVAGFRVKPPALPCIDLAVTKSASTDQAQPGDEVTYLVEIKNTGDVALTVESHDSQAGEITSSLVMPACSSKHFEYPYTVPSEYSEVSLTNEVTVTGIAEDGRQVLKNVSHTLAISSSPGVGPESRKSRRGATR